uniref:Uncharacterized protein n=1 Tax=Anagyrus vladimiri reovirus TaxID=2992174 RepID=A0A9E8AHV8_9REOV|nr:hypothetical protein [Anagyrus vladimiri reovirus]
MYFVTKSDPLYPYAKTGQTIDLILKNEHGKIMKTDRKKIIKVDPCDTVNVLKYLQDTIGKIDRFLLSGERLGELLFKLSCDLNDEEKQRTLIDATERERTVVCEHVGQKIILNDASLRVKVEIGLFTTFTSYLCHLIADPYSNDVATIITLCDKIFKGNQMILSTYRSAVNCLSKRVDSKVKSLLHTSFQEEDTMKEARIQTQAFEINSMLVKFKDELANANLVTLEKVRESPKTCKCLTHEVTIPFVPFGERESVSTKIVRTCNHEKSYALILNSSCSSVFQLGCVNLYNDVKGYCYFHLRNKVIMNISVVLERGMGEILKEMVFGSSAIHLYKSTDKIASNLRNLVHMFPSLELKQTNSIRERVIGILKQHGFRISTQCVIDVTEVVVQWIVALRAFNIVSDLFSLAMSQHQRIMNLEGHISESRTNLEERVKFLPCPEILYFGDHYYNKYVQPCLERMMSKFKDCENVVIVDRQGLVTVPCGALLRKGEIFFHPCYMPYIMKGHHENVLFREVTFENLRQFDYGYTLYGKDIRRSVKRSFCRLCSREYYMPHSARLCTLRCTVLIHVLPKLKNSNSLLTILPPSEYDVTFGDFEVNESFGLEVVPQEFVEVAGPQLVTEVPYLDERVLIESDGSDGVTSSVERILSLNGRFKNVNFED